MVLGGFVLGSLIIYLKGMRRMMFQLSGLYYRIETEDRKDKKDADTWTLLAATALEVSRI